MSPIRQCSRTTCREPAVATMTYGYAEATAVIGPLSPTPQAGAYDLCKEHAQSVTVPVGWQMVRLQTEFDDPPPSSDDLLALADAIRAASQKDVPPPEPARREVHRPMDETPRRRSRPTLSVIDGGAETDVPADGSHAPAGGAHVPADGSHAPAGGAHAPADGSHAPADAAREDGAAGEAPRLTGADSDDSRRR